MIQVRLGLHPKLYDLINDLTKQTKAPNGAEVIRRSVSLYNILLQEKADGKEIHIYNSKTKKSEGKVILP